AEVSIFSSAEAGATAGCSLGGSGWPGASTFSSAGAADGTIAGRSASGSSSGAEGVLVFSSADIFFLLGFRFAMVVLCWNKNRGAFYRYLIIEPENARRSARFSRFQAVIVALGGCQPGSPTTRLLI